MTRVRKNRLRPNRKPIYYYKRFTSYKRRRLLEDTYETINIYKERKRERKPKRFLKRFISTIVKKTSVISGTRKRIKLLKKNVIILAH